MDVLPVNHTGDKNISLDMQKTCALMSIDSEQSHYNKICIFQAPWYLGLCLIGTQNTTNILLSYHKHVFIQTQNASLNRLMGRIWPPGHGLRPCAAARGSGQRYLNERKL